MAYFETIQACQCHTLAISLGWDGLQCFQQMTFNGFNALMTRSQKQHTILSIARSSIFFCIRNWQTNFSRLRQTAAERTLIGIWSQICSDDIYGNSLTLSENTGLVFPLIKKNLVWSKLESMFEPKFSLASSCSS